ncbi:MAG: ABC transporter ATP-binding protein [Propionibacteriaceae bacterium]|nr:ABC transporter ATP-binding protein [Propionibacteriaceae bacterium]
MSHAEASHSHGLLEATDRPPSSPRLRLEGVTTARGLSRAVVASVWPWVLGGALLIALVGVARTLVPWWLGWLLDQVIAPAADGAAAMTTWRSLTVGCAVLAGIYVVVIIGDRIGGRIGWYGRQRAEFELADQVLRRCLSGNLNRYLPGEFVSRLSVDVRQGTEVLYVLVHPPGEVLQLLLTTMILWSIDPVLALAVPVGAPIILVMMSLVARPLEGRIADELDSMGQAAGRAADTLAGYRVVQGLGVEAEATARYRRFSRRTLRAALAARSAEAGFMAVTKAAGGVFALVLIILAVHRAGVGEVTIGELVTVTGLGITVVSSLDLLVDAVIGAWVMAQGAGQRLLELMASPPGHPDGEKVKMSVAKGEFIVVTGMVVPVQLLGCDEVLVAPRAAELLTGTVLENVMLSGADEGNARRMLHRAGLAADELANGYDTECGDNGSGLSGGQRQRVALARALASRPEGLVLTHPTSSVDAATEQRIAVAVREERDDRVTVVFTDSPAFRAVATKLLEEAR